MLRNSLQSGYIVRIMHPVSEVFAKIVPKLDYAYCAHVLTNTLANTFLYFLTGYDKMPEDQTKKKTNCPVCFIIDSYLGSAVLGNFEADQWSKVDSPGSPVLPIENPL